MNKIEYVKSVNTTPINETRVNEINRIYKTKIEGQVAKLISYADMVDFFDEERRALGYKEIIDATKDMKIDFDEMGIIPLIDAYDNTFIVYLVYEKQWAKFNIMDKAIFKKKSTLEDVI